MPSCSASPSPHTHRYFFIRPTIRKSKSKPKPHPHPPAPKAKPDPVSYPYNTYICEPSPRLSTPIHPRHTKTAMSTTTPPSFLDDGSSISARIPQVLSPPHIQKWISASSATSSVSTPYTGSFFDDGEDLLDPTGGTPGFGSVDRGFYRVGRRKEKEKDGGEVWNEDVAKAVGGDMRVCLGKVGELGRVKVWKRVGRERNGDGAKEKEKKRRGGTSRTTDNTVKVPLPRRWGTFVIRGEDGRVIVVDRDGAEFDSGPGSGVRERPARWVKAASTVPAASPLPSIVASSTKGRHASKERSKERKKVSDGKRTRSPTRTSHTEPIKTLTPIPESDYESGNGYWLSGGEDIGSPTHFWMTGGVKGWPLSTVAGGEKEEGKDSVPDSPVSKGFRYVVPGSTGYEYVVPASPAKSNISSPVRSPRAEWPSSPAPSVSRSSQGKTKTASDVSWNGEQFESAWKADSVMHSHKSDESRRSKKSHKSSKIMDDASVKTYSTYRAPTVEDAPNSSSEEKEGGGRSAWGGSAKSEIVKGWGDGSKKSGRHSSIGGRVAHPHTWEGSLKSWDSRPKAADNPCWTGVEASHSPKPEFGGSPTRAESEATWDGFERVKTLSEVSVAGSGSELGSRMSVPSQRSHHSHRRGGHGAWAEEDRGSQASHRSHRSSRHERSTTWETGGSQTSRKSSKHAEVDAWDHAGSQASWSSEKARVDDDGWDEGAKCANGFDEANETYLNDSWGGVPVRVGSRAGSGVGWT
ncbi:hypothetical protein BDW02DRAFT_257298 [Decorospora gaudefroyi]|uniref:Uncharacterized protein n=1 Tax=Decorospora gaudefroyi TaxID=184978 RepID=A0A6A5KJV8_9PLEO|nr:hypothetical protein BDW02DRAFT_257298 [Decorospora gaudefroyi]